AVEADRHARATGRLLAGGELLPELELEECVQVDPRRALRGEGGHRGAARVAVFRGPAAPVGAAGIARHELLAQRREDRPVPELRPRGAAVLGVGASELAVAVAVPADEELVRALERAALRREGAGVVDAARSRERLGRRASAGVPRRG